ncbi:choline/ethanolamine kinase isoform X2 [Hyposmocoma kahamanoa]|uniref:choline/ethanolamine kinase isoform X2 n=1 Tax=Hyposmocoma kahamanoa TaxID=1477025 RepID=UPI000E6D8DE9|nr:choline/ethanolamine kinase isoform X2 [Hyposmocoma kahamanoa]
MNKSDLLKLQMCGTENEMREVACRICKNYLHGAWKIAEPADLEFRRISGGLSNFIYYVALPDDMSKFYRNRLPSTGSETEQSTLTRQMSENVGDEPKQVLLRIYGQVHGERAMDAIVTESVIFTLLSERRLGPKLHGVFSGGRIEEFIHARPLLTKELGEPALSMKIAEKAAAIHSMEVPLSKEPYWMWKTMNKWLKTVKEERLANGAKGKNEQENEIIKRFKTIEFDKEIEWLKKFLAIVDSPVVFCHNDLQEGNILLIEDEPTMADEYETTFAQSYPSSDLPEQENNLTSPNKSPNTQMSHMSLTSITKSHNRQSMEMLERTTTSRIPFVTHIPSSNQYLDHEDANTSDSIHSHISDSGEPRLVLIDFEYCAYNYRGFDIANHFQEWGYDYTNPEYPFYHELQENTPTLEQKEIFIKEYLKHYNANLTDEKELVSPSIDAVNKLLNEVEAFTLASHLFWALWSIINASKSQIPFLRP